MQAGPPIRIPRDPPAGHLEYRVYFMDGTGKITHAHEFTASDDQAAIKVAEGWREGRRIELWQRARIVRKWD